MKTNGMGELLLKVREGALTFTEFAQRTMDRWRAVARYVLRRWRTPAWVGEEDVVQDLLIGAWGAIEKFDPSYGGDLARYVTWNAIDKAKKRVHKARGASLHRKADSNPGRYEVTFAQWGEHAEELAAILLTAPAEQEAAVERAEAVERAKAVCATGAERLVVSAIAAGGDLRAGAEVLYDRWETRLALRLSSEEAAQRVVSRVAASVAGRLAA